MSGIDKYDSFEVTTGETFPQAGGLPQPTGEDDIVLHIISDGPGRTLAVEMLEAKIQSEEDGVWQLVESGDLDGYYDGYEPSEEEEAEVEAGGELDAANVHPHCADCDATIFTNDGAWVDPWGDYHCAKHITFI